MNLDKTIKELTNRLDEVHPYSTTIDHENKNDGIQYWKGKKIISTKTWNDLYEKNSTYTNNYKTILTSRKPLLYFPDDYNGSISSLRVIDDELKEAADKWNKDFYELLEYRKNPTWGRMKCTKCLLSGSLDDPIFIGIEKVFSRIVSDQCNNNKNNNSYDLIQYHCNVLNIYSCPFESKKEYNNSTDEKDKKAKYPYKREDLFALHQISFAIEQAITTFFEITKQNEIIYEVDFENDRVQEIHTKYNGEPESWGWNDNVNEQLSKIKSISTIQIRDEQDVYSILTNREKLECLLQEYEKKYNHQLEEGEQQILLKENKQNIIDFLLDNKDSIRVEDLTIYEPIYKCYREKGNCHVCCSLSNIICISCNHNYNNNKEMWSCTNHWKQHALENHIRE